MFFEKNQTSEIKSFFNENGFAVIKNVFPKVKINDIRKIVLKNLNKNSKDFFYEFNDDKKILRRIEKITDHYHSIKDLIHSPEVKKLFMKLNKKQILFKDKLNFKFPNGEGFLPHLDGHFY